MTQSLWALKSVAASSIRNLQTAKAKSHHWRNCERKMLYNKRSRLLMPKLRRQLRQQQVANGSPSSIVAIPNNDFDSFPKKRRAIRRRNLKGEKKRKVAAETINGFVCLRFFNFSILFPLEKSSVFKSLFIVSFAKYTGLIKYERRRQLVPSTFGPC